MRGIRALARLFKATAAVAVLGLATFASAATLVAPAGSAAESSLVSGLNTPIRSLPRAYQEYFAASNFSSITQPVQITGMQLRLAIGENWRPVGYAGQTWPNVPISFARWDLQLSKPSTGLTTDGEYLSLTPTFNSYQDGGLTTVRSGPLAINPAAYAADGANPATDIHSFGVTIPFTTPYVYNPGDGLVMMLRHGGYTGGALDAFYASRDFQNGVTDAISSTVGADATAPSGFSSPVFIQFPYVPVPEPTSLGLLAGAGLLVLRRRRA